MSSLQQRSLAEIVVDYFLRRINLLAELTPLEVRFLEALVNEPEEFAHGRDIVRRGEKTSFLHVFLDGWACRYVDTPDGERQILACLLPGTISNRYMGPAGTFNYSVAAVSSCKVAAIPARKLEDLELNHPNIARALWLWSLVDAAIAREWMISLGRRNGMSRIVHLLCELHFRLAAVGLVTPEGFHFPVTQRDIADMVGLSVVHVNRILGRLREHGLIDYGSGQMKLNDLGTLMAHSDFDPSHLGVSLTPDSGGGTANIHQKRVEKAPLSGLFP